MSAEKVPGFKVSETKYIPWPVGGLIFFLVVGGIIAARAMDKLHPEWSDQGYGMWCMVGGAVLGILLVLVCQRKIPENRD